MKKFGGWICLVSSLIWCLLAVPAMLTLTYILLYSSILFFGVENDFITSCLAVLVAFGTAALAVIVIDFGIDILKSSWRIARGNKTGPVNLFRKTKKDTHEITIT